MLRTSNVALSQATQQVFRRFDLSAAATQVLAIIEGAGEPLPPSAISGELFITSASVTSLLDTLERRGLVVRNPHPQDRRMVLVDITDEARHLLDDVLPAIHAWETAALEPSERVKAHLGITPGPSRVLRPPLRVRAARSSPSAIPTLALPL